MSSTVTMNTIPHTITLEADEVFIKSTTNTVYNNGSTGHLSVSMSLQCYNLLTWLVIRGEMDKIPDVEREKVDKFINAGDLEMRNIGYTILEKYLSTPMVLLIKGIKQGSDIKWELENFVKDNCSSYHLSLYEKPKENE